MMHKLSPIPSRRSFALLATGVFLGFAGVHPAAAQNPFEFLFGRGSTPESAAPPQGGAKAPAGMPGNAVLPPKRPSSLPGEAEAPRSSAPAAKSAATPVDPASATPAPSTAMMASPSAAAPLNERQAVDRANAYFNGITSLVSDFVQIGGEGRRLTGKLYLQRPGKIRFEYDEPATLEVIADGSSVAVRDRKLATQDLYSIGQTPLKFLLRDRIDLGRDMKITEVAPENEGMRISLEDRSTLGGTSKITLYFDKDLNNLVRWRILDPQGFQTTVALANLERNRRIEQQLFTINYQRILGER